MRLVDASRYFDDIQAYEAYTDTYLFDCQFSSFDDSKADGTTSKRRTLSVAPDLDVPSRRVLKLLDEIWIVGESNFDGIFSEKIRRTYSMKKATHLVSVLSPGEALTNAPGLPCYGQLAFFKDQIDVLTEAEYSGHYNLFLSQSEPVFRRTIFKAGSRYYLLRNKYYPVEGYLNCQCDELDEDAMVVATLSGSKTYNPVTDSYSGGVDAPVNVLRIDFNQAYQYNQQSSPEQKKGDEFFLFSKVQAPGLSTKDRVTLGGKKYQIITVSDWSDAWLAQVRNA